MRLFRIFYNGYDYSNYYPSPFYDFAASGGDSYFLSYAAAEAAIPAKLSEYDIRNAKYYAEPLPRFEVQELSPYEVYQVRVNMGEFPGQNVWRNERNVMRYVPRTHHIHQAESDPRLIEFFDSNTNRITTMKPGKYLKKYLSGVLTDRQIAFYAEYWTTGERPKITVTVKFASTAKEILRVYNTGPKSCMKGSAGVTAYAAGDLAIAYAENAEGRIQGRALCWPERKIYGRIYPDPRNYEYDGFESEDECEAFRLSFETDLRSKGYSSIAENPNGFDGARLKAEPFDGLGDEGYVKMPYLDNDLRFEITEDREFRLKKEGIKSDGTGGYVILMEKSCPICSKTKVVNSNARSGDDMVPVCRNYYDYNEVSSSNRPTICAECLEGHTTVCEAVGVRFLNDGNEFVQVKPFHGASTTKTVLADYWASNGWQSDGDGTKYLNYDMSPVFVGTKKYAQEEVFYSRTTGQYYLTEKERDAATAKHKNFTNKASRPFQLAA